MPYVLTVFFLLLSPNVLDLKVSVFMCIMNYTDPYSLGNLLSHL